MAAAFTENSPVKALLLLAKTLQTLVSYHETPGRVYITKKKTRFLGISFTILLIYPRIPKLIQILRNSSPD